MSLLKADFVKRGFWVNVEKGPVLGATITTDAKTGNIVIALLAVLTTFGTAHLWNLVTFAYHQTRINHRPADGLFWQQQALLRTLPTPSTLMSGWLQLWWAWRKRTDRALRRSFPQITLSLIFTAATLLAGIFTSYIVDGRHIEILVDSPMCGLVNVTVLVGEGLTDYPGSVCEAGYSYAKDCYATKDLPERCQIFTQTAIPIHQERVTCPFGGTLCKNMSLPGLALDSGLVDGNALGLNLRREDRVKFRKKTTCSVLELRDYHTIRNVSNSTDTGHSELDFGRPSIPNEQILALHLGSLIGSPETNQTFMVSLYRQYFSDQLGFRAAVDYAAPDWAIGESIGRRLPEMESDSDLFLANILMNNLIFNNPVDDPMFSAHKSVERLDNLGDMTTFYRPDFPLSVVGCKQQYQFCFAQNGKADTCTGLGSLPGHVSENDYQGATELQLAALELLITTGFLFDNSGLLKYLNVAEEFGNDQSVTRLPNDKWVQEIYFWEQYVWAQIQIALADYAIGPAARSPEIGAAVKNGTTSGERQLCGVQKMRSPGNFVNINVFGLAFVIAICCLITILDIVILRFLIFLKTFRKSLGPRLNGWIQDGVFQLQRRAFEASDSATWERLDQVVPVTATYTELLLSPTEICNVGTEADLKRTTSDKTSTSLREVISNSQQESPPNQDVVIAQSSAQNRH